MWDYIAWAVWLACSVWFVLLSYKAIKGYIDRSVERDMERQLRSQLGSSSPEYSMKPYKDFANNPWMVRGDEEGLVKYSELNTVLLLDIRGALWEVRDAVKENTAYLKQVYGDPDDQ